MSKISTQRALTLGIFGINTAIEPAATSAQDYAVLEAQAPKALTKLVKLRDAASKGDDVLIKHLFGGLDRDTASTLLTELTTALESLSTDPLFEQIETPTTYGNL